MNIKRGSFRIWVVASIAWMIFAFLYFDMGYEMHYAYQYQFEYDALLAKENSQESRKWAKAVADTLHVDPLPFPRDPKKPDYDWFWILVLPQTAGIAVVFSVAYIAIVLAKRIYKWVSDGFNG